MSAQILVVDDDPQVRRLLRRCLETEGYDVREASTGADVERLLNDTQFDLITLDLALGSDDGLMIARDIRAKSQVPIIMVTGKGDTIDRVVGLEIGADDYITKPFHVREVLARVRSILRRTLAAEKPKALTKTQSDETDTVRFGDWTFDMAKRELTSGDGVPCDLTTGEFELLKTLIKHANRVLSRDQIMDLLKGNSWNPTDRTIDNQIVRLRKKIEPCSERQTFIKTVRGVGYTFTADLT